ncbi:phytanoyl-CoA dioxygenase family protein [Chitinophagaceae bacterium MMS25-I14]
METLTSGAIAGSSELCGLGIMHLKRYWSRAMAIRKGYTANSFGSEWMTDSALFAALNISVEPTIQFLYSHQPSLEAFEQWILDINNGILPREKIQQFNALLSGQIEAVLQEKLPPVLTAADLAFWEENGYVIIRNAVPEADCVAAIDAICSFIGADLNDPATWYQAHPAKQGIMVQLFRNEALQRNRESLRIKAAYQQLWGRTDLLLNTDRASFNPPETAHYQYPGPHMHWDVSLAQPIPFGLQGLLYLSDTAANQGAFTLVPGFQHRIDDWLNNLPAGTDPRMEDLHALGSKPIAANAGDFIIWDQKLPHASSPNTSKLPRIVQYINYQPLDAGIKTEWR